MNPNFQTYVGNYNPNVIILSSSAHQTLSTKTLTELKDKGYSFLIIDEDPKNYNESTNKLNLINHFRYMWDIITQCTTNQKAATELHVLKQSINTIKGALT